MSSNMGSSRQMTMDSMIPTKGMEYATRETSRNLPPTSRGGASSKTANPFSNPIQMKPINSIMQQRQQHKNQQQYHSRHTKSHSWSVEEQNQETHQDESAEVTIHELEKRVSQLTHELTTTRKSHQLTSDQYRAEISSLHSTIEHQAQRHEQIVSALRSRLVESEIARNKMQDALSQKMEQELNRQEEEKKRWNDMIGKVNEDRVWVIEQMNFWRESMEEYRKRGLGSATVRGGLDAELCEVGVGGKDEKIPIVSDDKSGDEIESAEDDDGEGKDDFEADGRKREEKGRTRNQRRRWVVEKESNDGSDSDDSDDSEAKRIFKLNSARHIFNHSMKQK